MKASPSLLLVASIISLLSSSVSSFTPLASSQSIQQQQQQQHHHHRHHQLNMSADANTSGTTPPSPPERHPHCDLPGDPSLILTTNVDLGDDKGDILKELSSLVATTTGKPETYVAVCITDKASMIFGGSTDPLALGCLYSLGAINMANNGKIQSGVTDVLERYGVTEEDLY